MSCSQYREAISAQLDGEALGISRDALDDHLGGCRACHEWAIAASSLGVSVVPLDTVPDRTAVILAAAADRGVIGVSPRPELERPWRWMLAAIAATQLALAVTQLVADDGGLPTHTGHELGAVDLALGLGFLFAAWRPRRAWGMLPLVAAVVGCLVIATAVDVTRGQARLASESPHAFELAGLAVLWLVARPSALHRRRRLATT